MFSSLIVLAGILASAQTFQPLTALRLYNAPHQALVINVEAPPAERAQLVLLDHAGAQLSQPRDIAPGEVDLSTVFTDLWQHRQTVFVQYLHDEQPVGSSLVLQPMLTPLTPQTKQELHADGTSTTRITGWTGHASRIFSGYRVYREQDVLLRTTEGSIRIALRPDHAPNTVWNIRELVRGGLYDNIPFHRVVALTGDGDPFVIQAGDPSGTGMGGPGFQIPLEPSVLRHDFGVISMARADSPDTAGSQFFICLSREGTARLDGQYCAFGYAVTGGDVIIQIADVELADVSSGRPLIAPLIQQATLIPAPPRTLGQGRPDRRVVVEEPQPRPEPGRIPR